MPMFENLEEGLEQSTEVELVNLSRELIARCVLGILKFRSMRCRGATIQVWQCSD